MSDHRSSVDRRDFLRQAGAGAAIAGMGLMAANAYARKAVETVDPRTPKTGRLLKDGEKIGIAMIGVGSMGSGHLGDLLDREKNGENIEVRAICDTYTKRQKGAVGRVKDTVGRTVDGYYDLQHVLERDDIHAVIIATPDHWHAPASIRAMDAGIDVYCQKPVTLTVEEALDVRDKVRSTGRVFQCGAQFTSADMWWQAREFIKNGGIGEVLYAQADYSRNSGSPESPMGGEWNYTIDPEAGPDKSLGDGYIDWEQWIGNSKKRPFSAPRFFQFRKFWDYSGGVATDLLYHVIAPLVIALDVSAPEKVSSAGGIYVQHDDREVPDTFFITADFPEDCSVLLTSSMANRQQNPLMIRGHRATIRPEAASGGKLVITPEKEFAEWFKKEHGVDELVIEEQSREDHMTNFLNAMRNRTVCHCSADTAYKAMAVTKLGCEAYRQDKTLFWDNTAEKQVRNHPRPDRSSKVPAIES